MEYVPPKIGSTNERLEAALRSEMEKRSLPPDQFGRTVHLAASLIELAYPDCDFSEKMNLALFNWFMIYIDDMASKDPAPFSVFESRFLSGKPQLDPALDTLVEVLLRMWEKYDPLSANTQIASVFEFITSSCIEPDVETLSLIRGGQRIPWFMRERTGLGTGYALMAFPKTRKIHILDYIQGIPDMNFWIAVTNDLLSFHKEELAGEKTNYIHNRAYVENKAPLQVLDEISQELLSSRDAIRVALANSPNALKAWKDFERGYIGWHIAQDRYKLDDLDL